MSDDVNANIAGQLTEQLLRAAAADLPDGHGLDDSYEIYSPKYDKYPFPEDATSIRMPQYRGGMKLLEKNLLSSPKSIYGSDSIRQDENGDDYWAFTYRGVHPSKCLVCGNNTTNDNDLCSNPQCFETEMKHRTCACGLTRDQAGIQNTF